MAGKRLGSGMFGIVTYNNKKGCYKIIKRVKKLADAKSRARILSKKSSEVVGVTDDLFADEPEIIAVYENGTGLTYRCR